MSEISPSKLGEQFDADFQKRLDACTTPEEIKSLMHRSELEKGLVREDWDKSILIPVPQPSTFATTITIAGVKTVLEASSEAELREKEISLYKRVFAESNDTEQRRDPATGQFRATAEQQRIADEGAAARVEADIVERALLEKGVDVESLREFSSAQYNKRWAESTAEFLNSPAGASWPGGDSNRDALARKLLELGLTDKPSVESIRLAYDALKKENALVENPEVAQQNRLAAAKSPEELREILNYRGDTAMWNR